MEEKSTFWKSAMIYGLYIGVILTFYSVILYVTGQTTNKTLGYLSFILYPGCIFIAQVNYRNKELDGTISYSQAFGFGVAIMLFSGIVTALYTIILYSFVDTSLIDQLKTVQEEAMLQKGMSEDQIEVAMSMTAKMFTPGWMSIMGLFGSVLIGTIISLITSIWAKKQPDEDAFEEDMQEVTSED
ncbi:MAG TPA: DUF4199 domain-containing protein [Prolixibacteraceae bacterium]|nr:DUF4199 domain-containing protein [Prolixibacteraceae bacterium]